MKRGNPWVRFVWLIVVLYMLFTVGRLAYKNYQLNMEESALEADIIVLQNEIQDLRNQVVYYQSDSYKEKMLRAKLGLKKEGESVVVITPEPEVEEVVMETEDSKKRNPQKWLDYFFSNEKI